MRRAVVPVCVALCSALCAHVAIDVAGDYLLAHDTYDSLAHQSRDLVGFGALVLAFCAAAAALRAAFAEARGSDHALCAAVRSALPRSFWSFFTLVSGLTFGVLCAMESLDSLLAYMPVDDAGDLFGGSLLLGGSLTMLCALGGTAFAWFALCRLARAHRRIARIVAAFVRCERPPRRRGALSARHSRIRRLQANLFLARRLASRAPPLFA